MTPSVAGCAKPRTRPSASRLIRARPGRPPSASPSEDQRPWQRVGSTSPTTVWVDDTASAATARRTGAASGRPAPAGSAASAAMPGQCAEHDRGPTRREANVTLPLRVRDRVSSAVPARGTRASRCRRDHSQTLRQPGAPAGRCRRGPSRRVAIGIGRREHLERDGEHVAGGHQWRRLEAEEQGGPVARARIDGADGSVPHAATAFGRYPGAVRSTNAGAPDELVPAADLDGGHPQARDSEVGIEAVAQRPAVPGWCAQRTAPRGSFSDAAGSTISATA